jgi:hypothetical protein
MDGLAFPPRLQVSVQREETGQGLLELGKGGDLGFLQEFREEGRWNSQGAADLGG